jgi:hypothetical protein
VVFQKAEASKNPSFLPVHVDETYRLLSEHIADESARSSGLHVLQSHAWNHSLLKPPLAPLDDSLARSRYSKVMGYAIVIAFRLWYRVSSSAVHNTAR